MSENTEVKVEVAEVAQDDNDALMLDLLSELADAPAEVVEAPKEVEQPQADDKVILRAQPATIVSTGDKDPIFVWTGLDRFETRAITSALNEIYEREDPDNTPDPSWSTAFFSSQTMLVPFADIHKKALREETSQWSQTNGNPKLGFINYLDYEKIEHGTTISGAKAVRMAREALCGGRTENLPLYQSGMWVTINPPLEADWSTLDEEIAEHRKSFGWDHFGVAFSNYSIYLTEKLLTFALKFVASCSVYDENASKADATKSAGDVVREHLDYFDVPILLAYVAHASYPHGYPYVRPAIVEKMQAGVGKLVPEMLNLRHCVVHDFSRIDAWQINHMTKRQKWRTPVADMLTYKEHVRAQRKRDELVVVNDNFHAILDTPTMDEVVESADRWLAELKASLAGSLTKDKAEGERQDSIRRHSRLASLRGLAPWVRSIKIIKDGKEATIDSREDIDDILLDARNDEAMSVLLYERVLKYMGDIALSVVAVPVDPSLEGMPKDGKDPTRQKIVQLDITSLIFILLERIREKSKG